MMDLSTEQLLQFFFGAALIAAWGTHIAACYATEAWWSLLGGALLFPIGMTHGLIIWFVG